MIALSYSRLSTYLKCPRQFSLQYVDKAFPDDSNNPHFVRGNNIHKQLEDYAAAKVRKKQIPTVTIPSLSPECIGPSKMVDGMLDSFEMIIPEAQISVDKDFKKVDWFSKQSYYRAIFDLLCFTEGSPNAVLLDWKTGKVRDYDHSEHGQLRLSACIVFSLLPYIEKVTVAYVFVDHKQTIKAEFHRDELPAMLESFHGAHKTVNTDEEWLPKVNQYCKWCAATPEQCEYATSKKW